MDNASQIPHLKSFRCEFKSEYKKNFQPFSKYNFDENKGVFEERPNTMDSLQNNMAEMESPSSWYKEVVLLRKKANQYRVCMFHLT